MKSFEGSLAVGVFISTVAIWQLSLHNYAMMIMDVLLAIINIMFWRMGRKKYL